jgi:hypothetical protein
MCWGPSTWRAVGTLRGWLPACADRQVIHLDFEIQGYDAAILVVLMEYSTGT